MFKLTGVGRLNCRRRWTGVALRSCANAKLEAKSKANGPGLNGSDGVFDTSAGEPSSHPGQASSPATSGTGTLEWQSDAVSVNTAPGASRPVQPAQTQVTGAMATASAIREAAIRRCFNMIQALGTRFTGTRSTVNCYRVPRRRKIVRFSRRFFRCRISERSARQETGPENSRKTRSFAAMRSSCRNPCASAIARRR